MKALTVLLSVVPGIGCYLGLIDGGYGVIEEIKTPAVAGALMSRLYTRIGDLAQGFPSEGPSHTHHQVLLTVIFGAPPATPSSSSSESSD